MIVKCQHCPMWFEDSYRTTICPHDTFAANEGANNFRHHAEAYLGNRPYRSENDKDWDSPTFARIHLGMALDGLSHYHLVHTSDTITRFATRTIDNAPGEARHIVHIYVLSDPEARRRFAAFASRAEFGMKPIPPEFS